MANQYITEINLPAKKIILAHSIKKISRESISGYIYILGNRVYKFIEKDKPSALKLQHDFKIANINYGLPNPYISIFDAIITYGPVLHSEIVTVIEMRRVDTRNFFQFSKGGEKKLIKLINNEVYKERLKCILRALYAAKSAKLTDPQGVYLLTGPDPILFLDIHCNNTYHLDFDNLILFTQEKLKAVI